MTYIHIYVLFWIRLISADPDPFHGTESETADPETDPGSKKFKSNYTKMTKMSYFQIMNSLKIYLNIRFFIEKNFICEFRSDPDPDENETNAQHSSSMFSVYL